MTRSEKHTQAATARIGFATLLVAAAAGCFGAISVLTTLVTRTGTPLHIAMLLRYAIATALMLLMLRGPRAARLQKGRAVRLLVLGGFTQAAVSFLSLKALDFIPVGPLGFLFYTYPAWVALISAARGVDRLTRVRALALVLALAGVAVMVGSPFSADLDWRGVTLALGSAVLYGAYLPAVSTMQRGLTPLVPAFYVIAGATIAFALAFAVSAALRTPVATVNPAAWPNILILAVVSTVGAFSLQLAGLEILGPVRTSIIATIEPFFTVILGALVLGERITLETILGGLLIAIAVIVIERSASPAESSGRASGSGPMTALDLDDEVL